MKGPFAIVYAYCKIFRLNMGQKKTSPDSIRGVRTNNSMKAVFTLLLTLLFATVLQVAAQKKPLGTLPPPPSFQRCGTQYVHDELKKRYPVYQQELLQNRKRALEQYQQWQRVAGRTQATYTIPVVVHVVMPNPAQVTDAQIQSQIDVLNADFAGLNEDSTRIPNAFKPLFGKSMLRFCLARRDEKGDATNGIVRVSSNTASVPGLRDPVKFTCNGGSDAWDPTQYLNIWVAQVPNQFLGYSFFASDPLSVIPLNERGFVTSTSSFGKGGTAQAPYNLGRTGTHEIGHFFDLDHTWGPNNCGGAQNCTDDDGVNDTPRQLTCNFGAPPADSVITDACSPIAPGIMWMNYMDYVDDRAMVMFTTGQVNRMQGAIIANPWILQLATSNACTPPAAVNRDVRFEGFRDALFGACQNTNNILFSCSETYRPVIALRNVGSDTVRTLTISARIGSGIPVVTNWSGTFLPQSTREFQLNALTLSPGLNANITIITANPNGLPDQKQSNDTGRLAGFSFPKIETPYSEGFESNTFPPANWQLVNPDGLITWERTTQAARQGQASMYINNYDYDIFNETDLMLSPLIPVRGKDSVFATFEVAAATYSLPGLPTNPTDTLEVLITTDCGATFQSLYKKWGRALVTTGNVAVDTPFIPGPGNWRKDSLFLGNYSSSNTEFIRVVFRNTTNFENNIYVDDVRFFAKEVNPNLRRKGVMATPNPFRDKFVLQHYPDPENMEFVRVMNSSGQVVWEKRIALGQTGPVSGPNFIEIDLSGQQAGQYFVQIIYRSAPPKVLKIIKQP